MTGFLIRRLLGLVVTLWLATVVVFLVCWTRARHGADVLCLLLGQNR